MPSNSLALINESIGPSDNITWVALAYSLGLSIGFLIVGRLSDIFGRRWFFIGGNALALIGAIVSGTATHVESIIGGEILGCLAGAVQISFTVAIAELVPNKHRPLWIAAIFFSSVEIACFGPVIAQKLVTDTKAGWRWSFYLDIIVAGLATLLFFLFYHPPNFQLLHKNRGKMEQLKRMDFVGLVLFLVVLLRSLLDYLGAPDSTLENLRMLLRRLWWGLLRWLLLCFTASFILSSIAPLMTGCFRCLCPPRRSSLANPPVSPSLHPTHLGDAPLALRGPLPWRLFFSP
jgi:MFS family permease